ncbi:LCP family protein [Pseudactinotalea sp. Z1739]|uniref:LCP family protein n=1 Tax=Pseudactinotalea sp. Z1739 TaxID=3413028 RepID=UPI003C7C7E90
MPSSSPAREHPGATRRHAVQRPRRRGPYLVALTLSGLLAFTGAGMVLAYQSVQGKVATHDLDEILGRGQDAAGPGGSAGQTPAPDDPLDGRAYNVLVMGSDARSADNEVDYGFAGGMRSDTNLIVHVAADRSRVDVVSIPRDLLVDVPSCPLPDGRQTAPMAAGSSDNGTRFNAAFAYGGQTGDVAYAAACTILTTEAMTGLHIDDFVVVDFDGFVEVIDAIGGVQMCFEDDINAPKANLEIHAGCHRLDGDTALGVARARVGVDDGSDISRIGRQQQLFSAIADEVLGSNLVTDTPALFRFLQATASSMTTSERIGNLSTMGGLAYSLRHLDTSHVTFTTVPFDWAGNVVVQNADGEPLWESLRDDEPMVLPPAGDDEPHSGNEGPADQEAPEDGRTDGDADESTLDARTDGADDLLAGARA